MSEDGIVMQVGRYELRSNDLDDELWIRDIDLAKAAGMSQPRDIRKNIKRGLEAGWLMPSDTRAIMARVQTTRKTGGNVATTANEYWLTRVAARLVLARLDTEAAYVATREMIEAFEEGRRRLTPVLPESVPVTPVAAAPLPPATPEEWAMRLPPALLVKDDAELMKKLRRQVARVQHSAGCSFRIVEGVLRKYLSAVSYMRIHVIYFAEAIRFLEFIEENPRALDSEKARAKKAAEARQLKLFAKN